MGNSPAVAAPVSSPPSRPPSAPTEVEGAVSPNLKHWGECNSEGPETTGTDQGEFNSEGPETTGTEESANQG